ncbi:MAG: DUF2934 domain-containing protein [Phycisphaeraceae bacterium]
MARKSTTGRARRTVGEAKAAVKSVVKAARAASKTSLKDQATVKPSVVVTLTHDQIANRAYFLWLAQGKPRGREFENWVRAESELRQSA